MDSTKTCTDCNGTGHDADFDCTCYMCNGTGTVAFTVKPIAQVIPPTEKQLAFISNLEKQRAFSESAKPKQLTKSTASGWIDYLMQQPKRTASAKSIGKGNVGEGYWVTMVDDIPTIVKVQVAKHGSNNLYAKRLDTNGNFVYEPGLINRMVGARPMSADDAKQYGDLYGRCFKCGAELTDEDSIARGMGPVCAAKMGW